MTIVMSGCGGTFHIVAPNTQQPVAASSVLFAPDLQPLRVGQELEVVGHFHRSESHWTIFWSLVALSPREHDLSQFFAEQISQHGGEAITGLTVTTDTYMVFNILGVVPLLPTLVHADIEGDVVRRRQVVATP